jgi:hypothetical protein
MIGLLQLPVFSQFPPTLQITTHIQGWTAESPFHYTRAVSHLGKYFCSNLTTLPVESLAIIWQCVLAVTNGLQMPPVNGALTGDGSTNFWKKQVAARKW